MLMLAKRALITSAVYKVSGEHMPGVAERLDLFNERR